MLMVGREGRLFPPIEEVEVVVAAETSSGVQASWIGLLKATCCCLLNQELKPVGAVSAGKIDHLPVTEQSRCPKCTFCPEQMCEQQLYVQKNNQQVVPLSLNLLNVFYFRKVQLLIYVLVLFRLW